MNEFDLSGPTLVHCAAGKDRTGVVVAVALMLADVDPEAIVADYQRTEDSIAAVYARMRERRSIPARIAVEDSMFRSPREAIEVVIEAVTATGGGLWGWFQGHGGNVAHVREWIDRLRDTDERRQCSAGVADASPPAMRELTVEPRGVEETNDTKSSSPRERSGAIGG